MRLKQITLKIDIGLKQRHAKDRDKPIDRDETQRLYQRYILYEIEI